MDENTNQPSTTPLGNERSLTPGQDNIASNNLPTLPNIDENTPLSDITKQYTDIGSAYTGLVENAADNVGDRQVQLVGNDFGATNPYMFNTYYEPAATSFASEMRQQGTQKALEVGLERAEEEARKNAQAAQSRYNNAVAAAKQRQQEIAAKAHISETDSSKMPQGTNEREVLNSEAFKKMNDKEREDALTAARIADMQAKQGNGGVKDWNIKEQRKKATSATKQKFGVSDDKWNKMSKEEKDAFWARTDVGNYWTEQYMIADFKRRGDGGRMIESFNDIHSDVRTIVKAVKDSTVSKLDQHVFETLVPIASAPDVKDWKFDNIKKSIENSDLDQARKDEYIAAMNSIGKDQFERLWKGYHNKDLEISDDGMLKHAGSTIGYNGLNGNNNPKYTYNGKSESIGFAIKAIYNSFAGNVDNIENMSAPDWMGSINYVDNISFTSPQTGLSVDQRADELFTNAFGVDWSSISALSKLQEENPDDFNYLLNQSSYILASGGAPFDVVDDPNKKYYIDGKYWSVNDENSPLKMGDLVFYSVDLPKNDKGEYADEDLNRFIELYSDIYTGKKEATDENKEALNKYYSSYQTSLATAMAASARYGTKVDENIYSAVLSMRDGADLSKLHIVNPSKPEETISLDELSAWFNSFNEDAQYNGYAALVNRTRGLKGRYYIYDDKMNGVTSVTERQNGVNTIGKYGKTSGSDNMEMANQVANLSDDQCLALNLFLDSQMKSGKIQTNFFDNDEVSFGDSLANQMLNSARGTATMIGAAGTFMWGFLTGQDKVISDAGKIWDEMTTLDQFDNMSWAGNSSRTDATLFNNYTEDVRKMQRSNLNHLIDTTFNIDYFDPNNTYDEATGEVKNSKGEAISYTDNSYFHKDDWKGFTDTMAGMAGFIAEATMEALATAGIGTALKAGKLALKGTSAGVKISQAKNALANYLTSAPTIGSIKQAHRLNQANAFVRKASEVLGSPTMTNYLINNIDDLSKVTEGLAKQAAIASGKTAAKEAAGNVAKEAVASFSDDAVKLGEKVTQTISNSADNVLGEGAKAVAESADNFTDDMLKSYLDDVTTGEEKAAAQNALDTLTQYKNLSDVLAPGLEEVAKTYKTQFAIDRMYMSIADDVDGVARTVAQKLSKYISAQIDNLNFGSMIGRGASSVIDDITYDGIKRAAVNVSLSEATGISIERVMSLEDDTARLLYDVMQSTRGSNRLITNDITKYISSRNFYSLSDDVSRGTINFKKAAEQLVSASETAQRAGKALSIDDALRIMARNSSEKGKLISTLRRSEFWRDRIADYSRDIMQGYYSPHLDEHFNSDYVSIEEYVTDPTQWLMGAVFDLGMSGARKTISSIKLSSVNRKLDKLVSQIDLSKGVDNDSALLAKNLRKMNSLKLEADRLTNKVFDGGISYNKVHTATTNIEKQINTQLDKVTNHFDLTKSLDFMGDNIAQAAKDSTALDRFKAFTGFGQTKIMSATEVNRMLIRSDDTLKSFIYANDALKAKFTARFADMVNSCPNVRKLTSKQYWDAFISAWDNTIGTTNFAKQFGANSLVKRKDGKYTNTINISDKAKAKELFAQGQEIVWDAFYNELAKSKSQLEGVVDFRSLKTELNGLRDRIVEAGYEMIDNGQPVRWNYFPTQGLMFEGAKDTPVALTGFYYGAGEHTSLMSNITDPTRPRDTMDMAQIVSDIKSGKTEYQRELSFNEKLRAKNRGEPEVEFRSVPYNEDGFNPLYAVTAYLNAYDSKKFAAPYLDPMRNGNIVIADDGILNIRMGNEMTAKTTEAAKYYNSLKEGYSKSASAKMTYLDIDNSVNEAKTAVLGKNSREIVRNNAKINSQKTKLRKTISGSDQFKSIANYMDINNPTDAQIAERLQSRFSTMTSDIKAAASGAKGKLSDLYNNPNSVQYRSVIDSLAKNKAVLKDLGQLDGRTINFGDVDLNYDVFNKRYYGVIGIMESTQRAIDNINASKKLSPELTLSELEFMSRQNAVLSQMDNVNTTKVINEPVQAGTFEASTAGHKEFSALKNNAPENLVNKPSTTTISAPRYSVEDFVKIREINEASKSDITATIYNMMLNKYGDKEFKGTKTFSSSNIKKTINQFAYDAYDAVALDKVAGEGITLAEVVERFNDTFPNAELFFEKDNFKAYNTLSTKISSYQNAGGDLNTLKQDIAGTLRRANDGEIKLTPEQTRRLAAAYYDLDEASFNSERITNRGRSELSIDNKVDLDDDEGATFESTLASSADYARDPAEIMAENANAAPTRDGLNISIDVNEDRSAIGEINNLNYVMDLMSRRKTDYKTRIAADKKTWAVFNDVIEPNYETVVNGINAQLPEGKSLKMVEVVNNSNKMSDANWLRITKQFDNGAESFSIGNKVYSRQEVAGMIKDGIDGRGAIRGMDPDKLRKYIADNKLTITEPMTTALATLDKTYKDFAEDFLDETNRRTVSGTLASPKDAINNILSSSLDINNRPLNFDAGLLASVSDASYSPTRANTGMKFPDADGSVAEINIVYDYGTGSEGVTGTAAYWYEKTTSDGNVIRYDSEEELAKSLAKNVTADDIRFAMNDAGYDLNIGEKMDPETDWFYHGDRNTSRGIDNVGPDYEDWQIDNANISNAKTSSKSVSSDINRINAEIRRLGDVTPLTAEEERMYKHIISSKFPYDNLSAEYKAVYDKAKKIEKYNNLLAAKRASASKAVSAGTNPMLDFVESTYAYNTTKSSIEIENALYGKDGKSGYIDTVNNLNRDNARRKLKRDSDYYKATAGIVAGLREMDDSPAVRASIASALENVKNDFRKSNAGAISDDIDELIDETIYQLNKKYASKDELVEELIQNNPTYKAMMKNIEAGNNIERGTGQIIVNINNDGPIIVNSDADVSGKISIKQLRESRELVAMKKNKKPIIDDITNRRKDKKILKSMRDGFTDGYTKKQLVGEATMNRQNKWIDNLVEAIKQKTGAVEIDESKVYINKTVASLGQSFFGEGTAGWQEKAYQLATSLSNFNKLMQDFHLAGGVGQYNAFTLRNALTMLWQDPIGGTRALFTNFRNARDNDSVVKFFINNSDKLLKYAMDSGDFSTINKFAPMFTMREETVGKGFVTSTIESVMDIPSTIAESQSKIAGFGAAMSNVYIEMFHNPTFARWTLIADADLRMRNYDRAKRYVDRIAYRFNLTDEDFETIDGGIWQSKDAYIANLARLRTEMYWRPQDFVKTKFDAKKFLAVEEAANNKRTVEALRSMPKKTTAADAFRNFFFAMNYKLQMNMHPVHGFGSIAASIYNVPRANMQLASKQSLNLAASRFAGGGNRNEAIVLIGIAALAHAWNTYIGAPSAWSQLWEDDERARQGKFSGIAKSLQNFQDFFKVWIPDQDTGKFNPQYANSLDPAFSIFTLQNSGARALNALINPNAAHISPQRNDFGFQNAQIGEWKFGRGVEGAMDEFVGANLLAGYKAAYEVLNNNTYFGNNVWEQPYLPDGSENPNYDAGRNFMASIAHILNLDGAIEGNSLFSAGSNKWVKGLDIDSIYWENGQQLDTPKTKGLKMGKKGKWQDRTGTVSGSGLIQHEYTTALAAINDGDYFEALSGAMELPFKSRSYVSRARTSLNQEVSMALRDAKKEYEQAIEGASVEEKDKAFARFASKAVEIVHDWSHEYGDVLGKNDELTATATKILMSFMSDEYDDELMYMQNMYVKLKQELRMADGDQFIFKKDAAEEAIAAGMTPEEAAETWNKHLTALKEAQMREYKARLALEEAGINDGLDTSVFDSTDFMYDKLAAEDATVNKKIYTEIKGKLESQIGEFKNFKEMKSYYEGLINEASTTKQKAKLAEKYNDYVTDVIAPYVEKYGGAVFNNAYWDGDNVSNHFGEYIIIPADQYYNGKSPRANYLRNKLGIGWANVKHPEYNENLPSDKEVKENLNEVAKALAKGQVSSAKALVDNALLQLRKGYIHAAPVDYDKLIRMRALLSSRSK